MARWCLPALLLTALCMLLGGCLNQLRQPYMQGLEQVIRGHDDPALVAEALPAYLLALDAAIQVEPQNRDLLNAGSRLYALYSLVFVDALDRRERAAVRARTYAESALCEVIEASGCKALSSGTGPLDQAILQQAGPDSWYPYAVALTAELDARRGQAEVLMLIPRVNSLFDYLVSQEPELDHGNLRLFHGLVLSMQPVPAAREQAAAELQAAVQLANGRNLLARLVRELRLNEQPDADTLNDIISANPEARGLTLQNRVAQQWAREYLQNPEQSRLGR